MEDCMTRQKPTSLLFDAVRNGDIQLASAALQARANVNGRDEEERTPLHWAAESGDISFVQLLIDQGADPSLKDRWGWTPQRVAAQNRCTEIVQLLKGLHSKHVSRHAQPRPEGGPGIGR
jgi:ankyrin repeat protein